MYNVYCTLYHECYFWNLYFQDFYKKFWPLCVNFLVNLSCKKIAKFDNVKKIIVCSRYQYCMYIETTCTYYT